ncbi:HAD family hydrolase [Krasilnikovia sp. M28-CT-15]|uniref:HAD family hydrolase n=1 Tax=Krasilnikovia sp. M28-CT-15 TaxID=3373540 RepID=UPI0038776E9E
MSGAAFFDVDDTLITEKSIFRFLAFALRTHPDGVAEYRRSVGMLRAMRVGGVPRETVNRAYYRLWRGRSVASVAAAGEAWFAEELRGGRLFHPPALEALRAHAARGQRIVLVSGSFPACLDPIARHVRADLVLCSRPASADGVYTGDVTPMIGPAKATAVLTTAQRDGIDLTVSSAYGDHASDLPVLRLVGDPVVVGDDPVLMDSARQFGWRALPAAVPAGTERAA